MNAFDTRCAVCGCQSYGSVRCIAHQTDDDRRVIAAAVPGINAKLSAAYHRGLVAHYQESARTGRNDGD